MEKGLGRRVPTDWNHVDKYPLRRLITQVTPRVERILNVPKYEFYYDQGEEGACGGYSGSWMMSILNRRRYDPEWLYRKAQDIDEWEDTPPQEGTSVRAVLDVLREMGHVPIVRGQAVPTPLLDEGIHQNRWAQNVDEIRTAIHSGAPVLLGVNWYETFGMPKRFNGEWWIGRGDLGRTRGGHAICSYKASDRRQAIGLVNTWGRDYPKVWIPYTTVERLLHEDGEAGLVVDRMPKLPEAA